MKMPSTMLLLLFSHSLLAGNSKIVPEDKAQLLRQVGQSVYVACKKAGPYSTNCQIDCGNGRRFSKASGYCYFMREGRFLLKVSTRYRNRDISHTATVIVSEQFASPVIAANASEPTDLPNVETINNRLNTKKNSQKESEQRTQDARDAENIPRDITQNEFSPADIQGNTNTFGRDSRPPNGSFSGNDVNIADQNTNRVVLR